MPSALTLAPRTFNGGDAEKFRPCTHESPPCDKELYIYLAATATPSPELEVWLVALHDWPCIRRRRIASVGHGAHFWRPSSRPLAAWLRKVWRFGSYMRGL